jgi:hypothetical protein
MVPPMNVIALVTVALIGDGFMLYALFQWMRDGTRSRNQSARKNATEPPQAPISAA